MTEQSLEELKQEVSEEIGEDFLTEAAKEAAKEILDLEDALEASITQYSARNAPKKLAAAAYIVSEYADKIKADQLVVTVTIDNGIKAISVADPEVLFQYEDKAVVLLGKELDNVLVAGEPSNGPNVFSPA